MTNTMDLEDRIAKRIKEEYAASGYEDEGRADSAAHDIIKMIDAEIERLRAVEDAAINAATYFHMGDGGEDNFNEQIMVNLMAKLGRVLSNDKP